MILTPPLHQLEQKITEVKERNLNGTLEQSKEQLRDAYMNFKDLQSRCVIDMKESGNGEDDKEAHRVFYFKPETFLLDDAEKQRQYRETLLKKVGHLPKPDQVTYLGDELHRSMCQTVADRSTPQLTKKMLHQYFKRRRYSLQHMKYKLLCRWAHHTLTSEALEKIGPEATLLYGKLEFNLEQAMARQDRLNQTDFYDSFKPEQRPSTKADLGGGALYVENTDIQPQSLIREDDLEVYIRGTSYRNKINKTMNKFLSRIKWLPLKQKHEIYEKATKGYFQLKNDNIQRQLEIKNKVEQQTKETNIMTFEMDRELEEVLSNYHCSKYDGTFLSNIDRIMHGWKANHDEVPTLISDNQLLRIKIVERALKFKLNGDINLDQGFSFSYQVTVFFPTYFQRQLIKSQFSIYDAFGEDVDSNEIQKISLNQLAQIDTNIFKDVTTQKETIPSQESLKQEFKNSDLKIMRLKSAAYWIDYVALSPSEPEWHQKQQALLMCDNPIDSLLQTAMALLDINDLSTISHIIDDTANLHQAQVIRLRQHNPHDQLKKVIIQSSEGQKEISVDMMPLSRSTNEAANIKSHLLPAVQGLPSQKPHKAKDDHSHDYLGTGSSLKYLPTHLLASYFTLRYCDSRDAKTRIMYSLNYFRSIQKRLAMDLREFATRDRIEGAVANPFIQSQEASHVVLNQVNMQSKLDDSRLQDKRQVQEKKAKLLNAQKMTVFDKDAIKSNKDMASLRFYKCNGIFSNKIFRTCPAYPKLHVANGEPLVSQPQEEIDYHQKTKGVSDQAVKLMNRIDFIEIIDSLEEVYIKDDFGIYIIYDCVLQDMKSIEDELCKVGSYFINKSEVLLDPQSKPQPLRDRSELLMHLLEKEAKFQFKKVVLCQVYMECYEHISDPLEQQRLMQIITDIMARRPRLNLQANYFEDAYDAEIKCLDKQFELVKTLVDLQISLEKTENERLQEQLNLSYDLANQYSLNRWKYLDAQSLLQAISSERHKKKEMQKQKDEMSQEIEEQKQANLKQQKINSVKPKKQDVQKQARRKLNDGLSDGDSDSQLSETDNFKDDPNQFSQLLGLPQISIETIYQSYREKDTTVLQLMQEHNNFVTAYEGYPEFLTMLTHRSIIEKNRLFKPNKWSQQTGALDFYDTLDFINKFHSLQLAAQQELYDTLKVWDHSLMTFIDQEVAEQCLTELRQVISYQDNSQVEYQGRDLVENEMIMGNSDRMIFYAKEMISQLTCQPKNLLCPFVVSKLDVQTVFLYQFPQIQQSLNKYTMRFRGIQGAEYTMLQEKEVITRIAKERQVNVMDERVNAIVKQKINQKTRALKSPCLLMTYCNMAELTRLRQEIIMQATETIMLQQVYIEQCELIGDKSSRVELETGIQFTNEDAVDTDFVNFVEHGPSHMQRIDLAIREFDPALLSNFDFRNPDSFKLNIITSGLEEVRAILQYQVMQKQLLIVATRINALVMDTYERAQSELTILEETKYATPNGIVNFGKVMNKAQDCLNVNSVQNQKKLWRAHLSQNCQPIFVDIQTKKNQSRSQITKEYALYQAKVNQDLEKTCIDFEVSEHRVVISRIMRNFRVKLLTKFVQKTLSDIYLEAQKVQALQSCNRLRIYNRFFQNLDPDSLGIEKSIGSLFKFETSTLMENFTMNYLPEEFNQEKERSKINDYKCLKAYEIQDYSGIPSTMTLLQIDAITIEDTRLIKDKKSVIRDKVWPEFQDSDDLKDQDADLTNPEAHLKRMLPTFTPDESIDLYHAGKKTTEEYENHLLKIGQSAGGLLDYEEAIYFGDTQYAQMTRYYISLERILSLEWFIKSLSLKVDDIISFNNAIESGIPFFKSDDFDTRAIKELNEIKKVPKNQFSQEYYCNRIISIQQKKAVALQIQCFSKQMSNFIQQLQKTTETKRNQYLAQYTEFRYQQIIGSLHKLVQEFYKKHNLNAVRQTQSAVAELIKMDHVKLVHLKPSNYSVNTSVVSPLSYSLESQSLVYGSMPYDDQLSFTRSVQPIINDKSLEPAQITLFQSLYQQDQLRKSKHQFAGQLSQISFKPLLTMLLSLSSEERQISSYTINRGKYQANEFMQNVYEDSSMIQADDNSVYTLPQLQQGKKFINLSASAILLKNALICWQQNTTLPTSVEDFHKFEQQFQDNYIWKQMEHRERIYKKLQMNLGTTIASAQDVSVLKLKIDNLLHDNTLATQDAITKRDLIVKALREEFQVLKKKVTFENYLTTKAEISVYGNEIEKLIINASIKTLDSECSALAKCFTLQVPSIQYHIHPFQQFAATFFDKVDPNSNLDVANKVNSVQELLTKTRNRATEVETLTSGPGIILTIKDLNEILIDFCRSAIQDHQQQFKSRSELSGIMESHLKQLIFLKDQKINSMEHRLKNIAKNLDSIISSRLFEKGNQLIYELDQSNRVLEIFKKQFWLLEQNLTSKIEGEQIEKFKRKNNQVEMKDQKFNDYKQTIFNMIGADFAEDQERIKAILKEKADKAKVTTVQQSEFKKTLMYPASGQNVYTKGYSGTSSQGGLLPGAVVPKDFTHYNHCICYIPDPKHPRPTLELAELDMLSEQEARNELARMCILVRKQRLLYRTKEMCLVTKYQTKINLLESQQNNNSMLWEQLAEGDKREKVLKCELVATQTALAKSDKIIEHQQNEIKAVDAERCRLQKFKSSKVDRLKDLEDKVKKIDVFENIDGDKLVAALTKKDFQLNTLRKSQKNIDNQLLDARKRNDQVISQAKRNLFVEQVKSSSMIEKMDQLKLELKMLEQNDSSVTSIWKKKCLDLFEVCQSMKVENEELRGRCTDLIEQGLQLANQIVLNEPTIPKRASNHLTSLPDLPRGGSVHNQHLKGIKTPETQRVITDTTFQQPSRNIASYGTNTFQSVSKDIRSEETNIPTEGVLHSARWAHHQKDRKQQNRNKSTMALTTPQSVKGQFKQNDIRSIIDSNEVVNSIKYQSKNKQQFQNAIQRKHALSNLHQDSLFQYQNSMGSNRGQVDSDAQAIQQLLKASRRRTEKKDEQQQQQVIAQSHQHTESRKPRQQYQSPSAPLEFQVTKSVVKVEINTPVVDPETDEQEQEQQTKQLSQID